MNNFELHYRVIFNDYIFFVAMELSLEVTIELIKSMSTLIDQEYLQSFYSFSEIDYQFDRFSNLLNFTIDY